MRLGTRSKPNFSVRHYLLQHPFDENASNHLAIGAAYATSVVGGAEMSEEELEAAGLNRSDVHVDFMIGSSQMDIDGIREDGTRVPLFRNGDWQFKEKLCLEVCLLVS